MYLPMYQLNFDTPLKRIEGAVIIQPPAPFGHSLIVIVPTQIY